MRRRIFPLGANAEGKQRDHGDSGSRMCRMETSWNWMAMAIGRGGDVGMCDWIWGDMLGGLQKGRDQVMYAFIKKMTTYDGKGS